MEKQNTTEFNKERYHIYTWKSWMMLHWILNPGLAVNELTLGQRVPKVSLEDKTMDKPRLERTFVPCPHCGTLHDGRTWSTQNGTAFKNWFGLYCIDCGNIIPCLTNAFSFVLLVVTFPIWGWFWKSWRTKWLAEQPKRFEDIDIQSFPNSFDGKNWKATGLTWGAFMFIITSLVFPYIDGQDLKLNSVLIGLVIWTIGGLTFGYLLKVFLHKVPSKQQSSAKI